MKKYIGIQSNLFLLFFTEILCTGVFIFSLIFSIINPSEDSIACCITFGVVIIVASLLFFLMREKLFFKIGFDEKGIYKFYGNKQLSFIGYEEIKKIAYYSYEICFHVFITLTFIKTE